MTEADEIALRKRARDLSDVPPDVIARIQAGFRRAYERAALRGKHFVGVE